ncbi:MAG: hypothetical protein PHW95_02835 [Patescibacteria group bacterium]|nr:hypothetical protein [Patescibacteria group bacterium]
MIITEQLLNEFELHSRDVVRFNNVAEAKTFVKEIWPDISSDQDWAREHPKLYDRLKKLNNINNILLISTMNDEGFLEICEAGLEVYFTDMIEDIDLWELIRAKLVAMVDFEARDKFKEKIRKSLLRNKGVISSRKILRNNQEYTPSIAEWLVDYTSAVGVSEAGTVKMNEYFIASKNYQQLNGKEKDAVRQLISIYERLKKSSAKPDGLEERVLVSENGRFAIFRDGSFESIDPKLQALLKAANISISGSSDEDQPPVIISQTAAAVEKTEGLEKDQARTMTVSEQEIYNAYQGDPRQKSAIAKEEENLTKKFGTDEVKLRAEFYQAVQKKNINLTIAIIRRLAALGELVKFLQTDVKLNNFLTKTWDKRYGQAFADEFVKNPDQPKFIKLFLRYILEERLGMNSSDAARVGLHVANVFVNSGKKSYNKVAYFDIKTKTFNWFEG